VGHFCNPIFVPLTPSNTRLNLPYKAVEMFEDISARALSCSEDIATFIQLHVDSTPIFEAANKIRQAGGVRRLAPCDMFLPPPNGDGKENEVPVAAKPQPEGEDTEMKDADAEEAEEVVALTKDEDVDEVIEEFSERLIHRDVQIDETPSADGKRVLKVCVYAARCCGCIRG
jgi:hypothetical protein